MLRNVFANLVFLSDKNALQYMTGTYRQNIHLNATIETRSDDTSVLVLTTEKHQQRNVKLSEQPLLANILIVLQKITYNNIVIIKQVDDRALKQKKMTRLIRQKWRNLCFHRPNASHSQSSYNF